MMNTDVVRLKEKISKKSTIVTINSDIFCGTCCCHSVVCHTRIHNLSSSCGLLAPKQH